MRQTFFGFICVFGLAACQAETQNDAVETDKTPSPVQITNLADGVWMHTSHYDLPGAGKVPSNGLVVKDGEELILVDTAWGEIETKALVEDIETQTGLPVTKVIITHFHYDRLAGVDWLEDRGATTFAHPKTAGLTAALGTPVPNTSVAALEKLGARTSMGPVEIAYPGPAHTEDNLMVYVKGSKILFGGCAVRAANHSGMGNTADADLSKWPTSLQWAKITYKDAAMVVPSHGQPGDLSLIDHSLRLLAKRVNADAKSNPESQP